MGVKKSKAFQIVTVFVFSMVEIKTYVKLAIYPTSDFNLKSDVYFAFFPTYDPVLQSVDGS